MTDHKYPRTVRRLSDGKILRAFGECGDRVCVEEMFEYADGGPSPRPLLLWHPASRYDMEEQRWELNS